jgi:hypothetical protein
MKRRLLVLLVLCAALAVPATAAAQSDHDPGIPNDFKALFVLVLVVGVAVTVWKVWIARDIEARRRAILDSV